MEKELEFLWWHMRGDFGLLMAAISWITAMRLVFKPVSKFLSDYIAATPAAQASWAQSVLGSGIWKFIAFTLDYLASVKLPSVKPETPITTPPAVSTEPLDSR